MDYLRQIMNLDDRLTNMGDFVERLKDMNPRQRRGFIQSKHSQLMHGEIYPRNELELETFANAAETYGMANLAQSVRTHPGFDKVWINKPSYGNSITHQIDVVDNLRDARNGSLLADSYVTTVNDNYLEAIHQSQRTQIIDFVERMKNRGLEVYVTGGAVRDPNFDSTEQNKFGELRDVDLVVVGSIPELSKAHKEFAVNASKRKSTNSFDTINSAYDIKNTHDGGTYVSMEIIDRYKLIGKDKHTSAEIELDISLVSKENLEQAKKRDGFKSFLDAFRQLDKEDDLYFSGSPAMEY